ncbi:c-type cytochrome [Gluconobacter roseus]|uniref:Cytochrome c n=1 Tax=Gluconobacter roseus NBRC 3990 TaxID=1307950 RepID=A0A4Y3M1P4_9PROT|nr:c-type cytochrome [Gluconobacter roseus]KXV43735.1 sorbitol dehydrogenase [Gluconobacter roseus]GBR46140.1 sorbitol dehydrogenase cytochrome c subunit [Gluconobacter roseus NBRC 3990]GEB03222.1 cytochrome c [Gluconobacter roseus NBRC 3990]GLP93680.1 cytochrome c [Gluconobacter roseus NBRC 3990]
MPDFKTVFWSFLVGGTVLGGLSAHAARAADVDQDVMNRGAYLATAADCVACHTKQGGTPFAGGLKIATPMGDIISTNITPDPDHGIGKYSEHDFEQALRRGKRRDGENLYPVMPYVSYAGMTDQDIHALYVWFMHGVKPVAETPPATQLSFPSNIRLTLSGWNMLAGSEKQETGDSATYDTLRRGKYLATALEHCGTCHTPRNVMLMEKSDQYLAGSPLAGWYAPNITPSKTGGIGDWSEDDIVQYLRTGRVKGKSQAAGPMGEAVEHSTSHLTDADLHALAAFIRQVKPMEDDADHQPRDGFGKANDAPDIRSGELTRIDNLSHKSPANLFDANCAACHGQNGAGTVDQYAPSLYKNSAVGAGRPDNLIMTILMGVNRTTADGHASMPAFGSTGDVQRLDDEEVASLVNYVSKTFGNGSYNVTADQVAQVRKNNTPH